MGDLSHDLLVDEPALSYLRYDVLLEEEELVRLGLDDVAPKALKLRNMSAAANRFDLSRIGATAAEDQIRAEHFPAAFDLDGPTGGDR